MYILYFLAAGYITYNLLHFTCTYYLNKYKKIDIKDKKPSKPAFENSNKYSFLIKNIEFYKDDKLIEVSNYNNLYFEQTILVFKLSYDYDYYIINYVFNDTEYKYLRNDKDMDTILFPMYNSEQLKNYVYINKISKALLILSEEDSEIFEEINILEHLLPFLGPNYNFYSDLENKLDIKFVLKNILMNKTKELFLNVHDDNYDNDNNYNKHYNKILSTDKYILKLYDTFGNMYQFKNNNLNWNPNLQL